MSTCAENETPAATRGKTRLRAGRVKRLLLPVLVLVAAGVGTRWMLMSRPAARRRPPPPHATLVEVTTVTFGSQPVLLRAMGTVSPARELDLRPRVKGEVAFVSKNLVPGGEIRAGEILLRLDARDYRLAVRQSASAVQQARASLKVELGKQALARKEYEVLGRSVPRGDLELVLRQPQLATAKAALEAAEAALERSRLDLERTTIRAAFNAVVQSRGVDLGAHVTEATSLARLIGTDTFWVELVVPVDQLRWFHIPASEGDEGAAVRIFDPAAWRAGAFRRGRLLRLAPDLEQKGRMARVIVDVADPLARRREHVDQPRLLIGSYVEAEIVGAELPSAAALSRRFLRDGDKVWVFGDDGQLDIRAVTVAHRGQQQVLITSGLRPGERVITSDLAASVQGMRIILAGGSGGDSFADKKAPPIHGGTHARRVPR